MNDFDKFIGISSKEISGKTHILEEFIIYIKDKDYGKIKIRAHFHGFIHSISDEYGFDLKFLLDEYEKFHNPELVEKEKIKKEEQKEKERQKQQQQQKKEKQKQQKQSPKSDNLFMNGEEIQESGTDGNNHFVIIGIILSLVLALFWFIFKDEGKVDKKVLSTQQHNKEQKNIKQKKEVTTVAKKEKKTIIKQEKKTSLKKKKKYTFSISKAKKLYKVQDEMLLLEPFRDNKLWLGLIDLNNKKQIGNVIKGLVSYKLKSHTIISTGHGYLNLINKSNDSSIKYRTFDKLFFYYRNGFLYQIKKEDVIALNGGFVW